MQRGFGFIKYADSMIGIDSSIAALAMPKFVLDGMAYQVEVSDDMKRKLNQLSIGEVSNVGITQNQISSGITLPTF